MDKMTMKADALSMLGGDEELVDELEEYDRLQRREKGKLGGMVIKSESKDLSYGGATTMAGAMNFIANTERREKLGESVGEVVGCLRNIFDSDMSIEEMKDKAIKVFYDAANIVAKKAKVTKSRGEKMSEAKYYSIGDAFSLKAAVRRLQELVGTKNIEIDTVTLATAVARNIQNLPPGSREKAALQLKADLKGFPGGEPTKPGSLRWIARFNSGLDPRK